VNSIFHRKDILILDTALAFAGVKTSEVTELVKRTAPEALYANDVFVDERSDGGKRIVDVTQIPVFQV